MAHLDYLLFSCHLQYSPFGLFRILNLTSTTGILLFLSLFFQSIFGFQKPIKRRMQMIDVLSKQELLHLLTNNSRYQIAKATGILERTLANYVNGITDIGRMSYDNAIKLTQYAKENNLD